MKNKKLIFSVIFVGILFLNTFLFTNINENKLQLNSLFTLATAQTENVENGENSSSSDCYSKLDNWIQYYSGDKEHSLERIFICEGESGTCLAGSEFYLAISWNSYKDPYGYYHAFCYYGYPYMSTMSRKNC